MREVDEKLSIKELGLRAKKATTTTTTKQQLDTIARVLSSGGGGGGGGGGKILPQNVQLPPPPKKKTPFNCLILKCAILSKILVECYMKTSNNGQCACMHQHFSPKLKFLDRTLIATGQGLNL